MAEKTEKSPDEKDQSAKYERQKEAVIVALLTAPSIEDAAKASGVGATTIYRWMKLTDFQSELKEARRQAVNQAVGKLQQSCSEAVDVLKDIMNDKTVLASSRVSAARTILDSSLKVVEMEDIMERLEDIEKALELRG